MGEKKDAVLSMIPKSTWNLLQLLSETRQPLSVSRMAALLKTSRRMIYYDLDTIRYLMKQCGQMDFNHDKEGYSLKEDQRSFIDALLSQRTLITDKEDRLCYIICNTIFPRKVIRLEMLMDKFDVSRNTILRDLSEVKIRLAENQLILQNTKKAGYYVEGDTFRKRSIFLYYLKRLLKHVSYLSLDLFETNVVEGYTVKLRRLFEELGMVGEDHDIYALSYLLLTMRLAPMNYRFNVTDLSNICTSKELKLVDEYFTELSYHERIYLTIHLLGSGNNRDFLKNDGDDYIYLLDLSTELVDMFEKVSCLHFEKREELINSIYVHLKLSYYNYCYAVPVINPLIDDVKANYSDLFKITEFCCMNLKDKFPYPFFDSEITYLTMHFGSFMRREKKPRHEVKVLIVCLNGVSSSMLLHHEILDSFHDIHVVDVLHSKELNDSTYDESIDFVISTVDFSCPYPLILVHPVLSVDDKAKIASFMMISGRDYQLDNQPFKVLLDIVRHHVDAHIFQNIQQEMEQYLNSGGSFLKASENHQFTLLDMIEKYGIQIESSAAQMWEDGIQSASQPLLQSGCIVHEYIEKMIELVRKYGPYIVISPAIAIAHAQPEDGVSGLGVTLRLYPKGLSIGNANVKLLFVLATPNQSDHLHILQNIASLNDHPETMDELLQCQNTEQVLALLKPFLMIENN